MGDTGFAPRGGPCETAVFPIVMKNGVARGDARIVNGYLVSRSEKRMKKEDKHESQDGA